MKTILKVENGDPRAAVQGFLGRLLAESVVEAVLVPVRTANGVVAPALVHDPALLAAADPLAAVMTANAAALVGKLSARQPRPGVAVVLRACELRGLVELVKLQQASLEHLTLIALDCAGTYSGPAYSRLAGGETAWRELYRQAADDPHDPPAGLRLACQMCEQPVYPGAEIRIELLGADLEAGIPLTLPDGLAAELGYAAVEGAAELDARRAGVVERLAAARAERGAAEFAGLEARLGVGAAPNAAGAAKGAAGAAQNVAGAAQNAAGAQGEDGGLAGLFAACIRCHNCMTVCPICYCKTCVFRSAVFDHEPMQYLNWAQQKGACRMPGDGILFHLTRMNHMALSCVGCGMCSEACPAELPVGLVFRSVARRLHQAFDYLPGRSLDEPLPLVTFKADEWNEVGA